MAAAVINEEAPPLVTPERVMNEQLRRLSDLTGENVRLTCLVQALGERTQELEQLLEEETDANVRLRMALAQAEEVPG